MKDLILVVGLFALIITTTNANADSETEQPPVVRVIPTDANPTSNNPTAIQIGNRLYLYVQGFFNGSAAAATTLWPTVLISMLKVIRAGSRASAASLPA